MKDLNLANSDSSVRRDIYLPGTNDVDCFNTTDYHQAYGGGVTPPEEPQTPSLQQSLLSEVLVVRGILKTGKVASYI